MSNKWRRYLYLVVDHLDGTYLLRRIDSSTLFFPATQKITPSVREIADARLPPPYISFAPSGFGETVGSLDFFTMFGRGSKKSLIAGADEDGYTFMFDVDHRIIHNHVRLNSPKQYETVSLAVGDALYVMDKCPCPPGNRRCGFEALVVDFEEPEYMGGSEAWRWHCLQLPPYVLEPGYIPASITAHTVVGGSDIWISTPKIGTYSFHTSTATWSKVGKWVLPFHGRADYYPEYDLWLGFSAKNSMLCSLDINTTRRPVVHSVLEEEEEDKSEPNDSYLVHLGSGKFCIAKFFEKEYELPPEKGYESHICPQLGRFAVFTGFEMDLSGPGGKLRMRKHKSRRYLIEGMTLGWVF
ncbi:hypothetical protein QOZ80_3BG0297150 [Eleusine coracana subsp. coracana]|nr:hypothetical protein QOZ80_3BG0297150 [Eleusine coracana subsp. coracana]